MMNANRPDFSELVRVFGRIGLINFGGPAGQIALMHRALVDDRDWVSEEDFLHALNFCHLLPGPEAQQLATYIGWKLHALKGGLAAGLLFILPGALVVLGLTVLYALAAGLTWFAALFTGIKAAVLAIVVQALFRIAGRALDTTFKRVLAGIAFVGLFVLSLPFPLIVLGAGLIGVLAAKARPDWLKLKPARAATTPRPRLSGTLATVAGWSAVWAAPMLLVQATLGTDHELWRIGSFFSQLAVVTFGGAYAVLAYMAQEAVQGLGWLNAGEMADGLGLAETTPGPLILVTQFVGFLAAFRAPEPFSPMIAGLLGAGLTTWVTFAPCFLWIFAFAPWIEHLQASTRLRGGLAALTAAIVGVIANLSLWFALHVLFRRVGTVEWGAVQVSAPDVMTLDWRAATLTALAFVLLFPMKCNVPKTLAAAAATGLVLSWI